MKKTRHLLLCLVAIGLLTALPLGAQGEATAINPMGPEIKVTYATLAPQSSTWGKSLSQFTRFLFRFSGQTIRLKVFYGGQMGDEAEMVEKIQAKQIDGGAFTGNGLGRISGDSRVLEIPGLFRSLEEVDYVYPRMEPAINVYYEKKGLHLVCLTETGYAYFFTKKPVKSLDDVRKTKMWLWKGDVLVAEFMQELKIPAVPVNFIEVNSALQTGMIDGFYATPSGAAAMQWNNQVGCMYNMPITMVSGGLVISLDVWKKMNTAQQELFTQGARKMVQQLAKDNRASDKQAIAAFAQTGMAIQPPGDPADVMDRTGQAIESRLSGNLYPAELRTRARALVNEFRSKGAGAPK